MIPRIVGRLHSLFQEIFRDLKQKVIFNLLKKYLRRASPTQANVLNEWPTNLEPALAVPFVNSCLIYEFDGKNSSDPENLITYDDGSNPEGQCTFSKDLTPSQRSDLQTVLAEYPEVFSDKPGCTNALTHKIRLNSLTPIRNKNYPVPLHLKKEFEREGRNPFGNRHYTEV